MRIVLKSDSGEEILCDGHVTGPDRNVGPMDDMRSSSPILMEIAQYLRGETAKPIARGNARLNLAFSVTRECADAAAAEHFMVFYHKTVLRKGTLYVIAEGSEGKTEALTLRDAVLQEPNCQQIGCTVIIHYTIVGGAIV